MFDDGLKIFVPATRMSHRGLSCQRKAIEEGETTIQRDIRASERLSRSEGAGKEWGGV